jgi:hypothetical protein
MVDGEDDASAWLRRRTRLCHPEGSEGSAASCNLETADSSSLSLLGVTGSNGVGSVTGYEAFSSSSIVVISDCA